MNDRPEGKPFCFWLGTTEPHRPYAQGAGVAAGNPEIKAEPEGIYGDVSRSPTKDFMIEHRSDPDVVWLSRANGTVVGFSNVL